MQTDARLLQPLAAADTPGGVRRRSVLGALVIPDSDDDDSELDGEEAVGGRAGDNRARPHEDSAEQTRHLATLKLAWEGFDLENQANPTAAERWRLGMAAGFPAQELTQRFVDYTYCLHGKRSRTCPRVQSSRRWGALCLPSM